VAVRLAADSWRWAGVPILIRAGKCLPVTATEVTITFRRPPYDAFGLGGQAPANLLRFRVNPQNRVSLTLVGKKPGAGWLPEAEELRFAEHPGSDMRPYDRLIGAALDGQRWLFASQDTVEAAWRVVDPVLGDVGLCTPTPAAAGAPNRPAASCPSTRRGTTRRADDRGYADRGYADQGRRTGRGWTVAGEGWRCATAQLSPPRTAATAALAPKIAGSLTPALVSGPTPNAARP